jgi:PAS domain S-box-containing protein
MPNRKLQLRLQSTSTLLCALRWISIYDARMRVFTVDQFSGWTLRYAVKPCAIAGFFVLVAFLWTLFFQHAIAYPFLFLFFGAAMGSAWFGGIIAGFMAVALSSILVAFFFVPPYLSMSLAEPSQTYFAAFVFSAIAITLVSSAMKRSEVAIRNARDQLEAKVQERTAELRQSNLELQESGRRLRMLTEAIPQQMWTADAAGSIEYCNQHLISYIGGTVEGAIGDAFFQFLHPVDERLFRQAWCRALEHGKSFEIEVRVLGADGVYRWFLIRSVPQHSANGPIIRWYGIHIDIEEQYRAQQGLIVAQDKLSRLSRTLSLGELAASIAHELNQPLTAVVTHAYACREWLRTEPVSLEKAAATADKIVRESTRAAAVISRVRALFHKDATTRESTDLNSLARDMVQLMRDEMIRRNAFIKLELADDLPRADLDPVQIQQVLLNLVTNGMDAMAATNEPGELTIRTEKKSEDEIQVIVRDRGPGLTSEVAQRMFEPFFSTKPQGTGMGLAICRSIVEAHDGKIWAAEFPEGGAEFRFTIRVKS